MEIDLETIERYIHRRMDEGEREAFLEHMAQDPVLAERVSEAQAEVRALQLMRELDLREKFLQWEEAEDVVALPTRRIRLHPGIWLGVAAAIAFLVISLWPQRQPTSELPNLVEQRQAPSIDSTEYPAPELTEHIPDPTPSQTSEPASPSMPEPKVASSPYNSQELLALGETNFQGPILDPAQKGTAATSDTTAITKARKAMQEEQYRVAIAFLTPLDSSRLTQSLDLRGASYVATGAYRLAAKDYRSLASIPHLGQARAQWNQVITHLMAYPEDTNQWLPALRTIQSDPSHNFQTKASTLLNQLADQKKRHP